jgi:predicted signal transduction protein with EAL and GGDEF domain
LSEAEYRKQKYLEAKAAEGVPKKEALFLYKRVAGEEQHPVSGYAPASDRVKTMERGLAFAAEHGEDAIYVEIDIRNLGGINEAVGRTAADKDVGVVAQIIKQHLDNIGADVAPIHHGGDELSAVIVGPGITKAQVERVLADASARVDVYVKNRGLDEVRHLKDPTNDAKKGFGFTFAAEKAGSGDDAQALFDRAGLAVEAKKKAAR